MYFIGVDVGTTSVKILAIDELGKIIKTVTKEYPIYFPQHPEGRSRVRQPRERGGRGADACLLLFDHRGAGERPPPARADRGGGGHAGAQHAVRYGAPTPGARGPPHHQAAARPDRRRAHRLCR